MTEGSPLTEGRMRVKWRWIMGGRDPSSCWQRSFISCCVDIPPKSTSSSCTSSLIIFGAEVKLPILFFFFGFFHQLFQYLTFYSAFSRISISITMLTYSYYINTPLLTVVVNGNFPLCFFHQLFQYWTLHFKIQEIHNNFKDFHINYNTYLFILQ